MRPPSSEARGGSAAARGKRSVYGLRQDWKTCYITSVANLTQIEVMSQFLSTMKIKNNNHFAGMSSVVRELQKRDERFEGVDHRLQEIVGYHKKIEKVVENIGKVMIGKEDVATLSLVALLAQGHVLLEDVPGVGKTMLVRTLAKSLDCDFRRIQFTPDLLPSDVTGISIYNPKELEFEFRAGPILGNVVLADEINRTSPKTQSSMLEAMEEKSVTVDGETIPLKQPFFVMATQNPIEYEGTYPLPEAQLDRFLLKLKMGYPSMEEELEMLERTAGQHPIERITSIISKEELIELQEEVQDVYIDQTIQYYIVNIATGTRTHRGVHLGVSPRGSIALMRAAKAYAYIHGRDYVLPDDVKYLAPFVFAHRIILTSEARYEGMENEQIVKAIVKNTAIPIRKEFRS